MLCLPLGFLLLKAKTQTHTPALLAPRIFPQKQDIGRGKEEGRRRSQEVQGCSIFESLQDVVFGSDPGDSSSNFIICSAIYSRFDLDCMRCSSWSLAPTSHDQRLLQNGRLGHATCQARFARNDARGSYQVWL